MNPEDLTLRCRHCGSANRIPVERALKDLTAVTCGRCKGGLLRVAGEPLPEITDGDLTHPFDRDALEKLRAVPFVDKIVSKVMSGTVDKLASFYMLADGVRVSERQAPRLWHLYLEAAGRIDVDPPPLYIKQTPVMNALAYGAGSPSVAVTTGLLDGMEDREILGVLGHELTHVRLGHVLYRTVAHLLLLGGLGLLNRFFGIGALLAMPLQLALFRWYQMAELSADRGEVIATGSLRTAVRCHMLLSGGSSRFLAELDEEEFIEQAHDAEKARDNDLLLWVMELLDSSRRTHPLPAWRVHHVLKYARSEDFFRLLAGQPTLRIEAG